jgi:hypothetical protein
LAPIALVASLNGMALFDRLLLSEKQYHVLNWLGKKLSIFLSHITGAFEAPRRSASRWSAKEDGAGLGDINSAGHAPVSAPWSRTRQQRQSQAEFPAFVSPIG